MNFEKYLGAQFSFILKQLTFEATLRTKKKISLSLFEELSRKEECSSGVVVNAKTANTRIVNPLSFP